MNRLSHSVAGRLRGMLEDKPRLASKFLYIKSYKRCVYEAAKMLSEQFGKQTSWLDQQLVMAWALHLYMEQEDRKEMTDAELIEWGKQYRLAVIKKCLEYLNDEEDR